MHEPNPRPEPFDPASLRSGAPIPLPPSLPSGPAAPSSLHAPHAPRARFDAFELAAVLSHYDTGVIDSLKDFPRGSSRSPKLVIHCERGALLLKRRGPGRDDPRRVSFAHAVQLRLSSRGFPTPRIIGTRRHNASMLTMDGRIYELFEFIAAGPYDHSIEATQAAGAELALLHQSLADFHPEWTPPQGGFHNETRILAQLASIPARVPAPSDLPEVTRSLARRYEDAARRAEDAGLTRWPRQIIHGDWHPGNLLFRGPQIAAVVDFDAARVEPRALDLANAALQFSITLRGQDPSTWPETLDEARLQAFCRGYDSVEGCRIATSEILALPWLMIEALIVEAVIPIAATGSFAQLDGAAFMRMVDRKAKWIEQSAERLSGLIDKLEPTPPEATT